MKDRSDDPSHHERTLLPWSYISLPIIALLNKTFIFFPFGGARCSSVVEFPLMVCWIVGSILHGGPTELFLIPFSAPLDYYKVWHLFEETRYFLLCWNHGHLWCFSYCCRVNSTDGFCQFLDLSFVNGSREILSLRS